jgi:hypothetical protein
MYAAVTALPHPAAAPRAEIVERGKQLGAGRAAAATLGRRARRYFSFAISASRAAKSA